VTWKETIDGDEEVCETPSLTAQQRVNGIGKKKALFGCFVAVPLGHWAHTYLIPLELPGMTLDLVNHVAVVTLNTVDLFDQSLCHYHDQNLCRHDLLAMYRHLFHHHDDLDHLDHLDHRGHHVPDF